MYLNKTKIAVILLIFSLFLIGFSLFYLSSQPEVNDDLSTGIFSFLRRKCSLHLNNKKDHTNYSSHKSTNYSENSEMKALVANNKKYLKPGDYLFYVQLKNIQRYYLLHVPKFYDNNTSLVLAFHGGGGNARKMASQKYKWKQESEKKHFVVAFPNGTSGNNLVKGGTWNAGDCCGLAARTNIDDIAFVEAIVNNIKKKLPIGDIFAAGMSNGGMFADRLACQMSNTFKAVAVVAGTNTYNNCYPDKPISILYIHGLKDNHVPFYGGIGKKSLVKVDFKSIPQSISEWKERNGCFNSDRKITYANGLVSCSFYNQCKNGTRVESCVVKNGDHSWPFLPGFSTTEKIWDFFSKH